jgi:hypothetical protein
VQTKCSQLVVANETLKSNEAIFQKNFSSLLLTARTEVDRKDRQVEEFRKKSAGGGFGANRNAPAKRSTATQTYENGKRSEPEHKTNGGGRKRSRSPKDSHEPLSKRYRNHSGDERNRNDRYTGRQQDSRRREDEHQRGDGRSQRRDDSWRRRRSSERRDDRGSREKRSSERVKKEEEKPQKKKCESGIRNKSPVKGDTKIDKTVKEIKIEPPLPVEIEKPEEPKVEPPAIACKSEEKLPDAPKSPAHEPPPTLPQTIEIDIQPVSDLLGDAHQTDMLQNALDSKNDGQTSWSQPSETCQISVEPEVEPDPPTHQQLAHKQPDQVATLPEATNETTELPARENLNISGQSGLNYVIQVVNENEFECFVNLNRKKKRKKERKKSVEIVK